jgi:hypothetical protein
MDLPSGWNKCLTHLTPDEQLTLGAEELEWAREYERRALRSWARFPLDGDIYESLRDLEVSFLTHWKAPFTGGGTGTLPSGTRVRVHVYDPEPVAVAAEAFDNPALEGVLVALEDRKAHNYGGYSLHITTEQLNRHYRLIQAVGAA